MSVTNYDRPRRLISELNPDMERRVANLMTDKRLVLTRDKPGFKEARFELYEAFRLPSRQDYLIASGPVTKARKWQSAHQYGLAVDFAVFWVTEQGRSGWSWDPSWPWERLKVAARAHGLDIPIEWDMGHVEHPVWPTVRAALKTVWG